MPSTKHQSRRQAKRRYNFNLPESHIEKLRAMAEREGVSLSSKLAGIIQRYVNKKGV